MMINKRNCKTNMEHANIFLNHWRLLEAKDRLRVTLGSYLTLIPDKYLILLGSISRL